MLRIYVNTSSPFFSNPISHKKIEFQFATAPYTVFDGASTGIICFAVEKLSVTLFRFSVPHKPHESKSDFFQIPQPTDHCFQTPQTTLRALLNLLFSFPTSLIHYSHLRKSCCFKQTTLFSIIFFYGYHSLHCFNFGIFSLTYSMSMYSNCLGATSGRPIVPYLGTVSAEI